MPSTERRRRVTLPTEFIEFERFVIEMYEKTETVPWRDLTVKKRTQWRRGVYKLLREIGALASTDA